MSPKTQLSVLRAWHALLAGGYLVAYLTADEDTYVMHLVAGYVVLAAAFLRLAIGFVVRTQGPLRLSLPSVRATRDWLVTRRGRHPLFAWFAISLLVTTGLAGLSGILADRTTAFEDPHEAMADISLWIVFTHVAFVTWIYGGRRALSRIWGSLTGAAAIKSPREPA